jgi:hypothetical protein
VSAVRLAALVKTTVPSVPLSFDVAATIYTLCPKAFIALYISQMFDTPNPSSFYSSQLALGGEEMSLL